MSDAVSSPLLTLLRVRFVRTQVSKQRLGALRGLNIAPCVTPLHHPKWCLTGCIYHLKTCPMLYKEFDNAVKTLIDDVMECGVAVLIDDRDVTARLER